ncbi:hypothetical protein OSB04_016966 [Centaurea solstitialis]|uniref:Uncharacterized protein n=1 Tax=Centaurea solstitialis TaxID=347529 RepID=A0AA38WLL8_9ASTR|nr:hypothetical protein OSB04_016966 [Centaurea solstitialis]
MACTKISTTPLVSNIISRPSTKSATPPSSAFFPFSRRTRSRLPVVRAQAGYDDSSLDVSVSRKGDAPGSVQERRPSSTTISPFGKLKLLRD